MAINKTQINPYSILPTNDKAVGNSELITDVSGVGTLIERQKQDELLRIRAEEDAAAAAGITNPLTTE